MLPSECILHAGAALNKKLKYAAAAITVFAAAIYINNTNHLAAHTGRAKPVLLAHRGIAQRFDERDLKNDTCTAARMLPSGPRLLWRTRSSSMRAGFAPAPISSSSTFIPRPTANSRCFTTGRWIAAPTATASRANTPWPYLKKLDIGHGYTADGGKTFPFRGKGIGLMPTLEPRCWRTFPQARLLVNVKSRDPSEGEKLAAVLNKLPAERRAQIMVYGGDEPVETRAPALLPGCPNDFTLGHQELLCSATSATAGAAWCRKPAATRW